MSYFLKCSLLGGALLGGALAAPAQSVAPDSTKAALPPHLLLKMGLRLTHLRYSPTSQTWQLVVPAAAGAEYRLGPRLSLYGLAEADLQASRLAIKHHRQAAAVIPSAQLNLGVRYYYDQPKQPGARRPGELYGNYVAVEGSIERTEITAQYINQMRRQLLTSLTPSLYALWGTQHQFRRFALYDLNAGLGIQAPTHYSFEHVGATHYDVAAQVNVRIYYGFGF